MTTNEWRAVCAWAIVHAEARAVWQLDVYAKVGGLAVKREDDAELMSVYTDLSNAGPCNWSWHNGYRRPVVAAILGREPERGERVVDTFNAWVGVDPAAWPDVLPVKREGS